MVLVKFKNPNTGVAYEYYMDDGLKDDLDNKVIPGLKKKDEDRVYIVDGQERSGKTVFAMQMGAYVDHTLTLDRVCFSPEEFRNAVLGAKKGQCVIFDEAFRGLSTRGVLTEVNRLLVSLMMEMGQKNLFILINLPTFFLLEKYVALWRARGLFHIYVDSRTNLHFWRHYDRLQKKLLFLKGKKTYDYSGIRTSFWGKFYNKYTVPEEEYREKKRLALKKSYKSTRSETYQAQRNKLFYIMNQRLSVSQEEIGKLCKDMSFRITQQAISEIISQFD